MADALAPYVVYVLNGLAYGMLLFSLSVGLSLIFGLMDVMNLAHGSFYLLGAYIALSIAAHAGGYWLALLVAPLVLGLIGLLIAGGFLRLIAGRGHLDQVLLTLGFAYVFADISRWIWGGDIFLVPAPAELATSISILGRAFPLFRLFVIGIGLILALVTWIVLERTRLGAIVRAGVSDAEMLNGLGINVTLVFTLVFALGALLAGFGGVIGGPILGVFPGVDLDILIIALIVVVVGGLGTFRGAFWGSILVGEVQTLGVAFAPQIALFLLFGLMALVLLVRPTGLLGQEVG